MNVLGVFVFHLAAGIVGENIAFLCVDNIEPQVDCSGIYIRVVFLVVLWEDDDLIQDQKKHLFADFNIFGDKIKGIERLLI